MNTAFFQLLWQGCPEVEKFGGGSTMFLKIFLNLCQKSTKENKISENWGEGLLPRRSPRCRDTPVFWSYSFRCFANHIYDKFWYLDDFQRS